MDITGLYNMAIGLVGGNKILSPADESIEAEECNLFYDTARTFCLESRDWTFAAANRLLAVDAIPVSTEFSNSFSLPTKCLVVRIVSASSDLRWPLEYQMDERKILADSDTVYIKYTKNVEDPNLFSPSFTVAVAHKLAELISPVVTGDKTLKRTLNQETDELLESGGAIDGMQGSPKRAYASRLVNARFGYGTRYGLGSTI